MNAGYLAAFAALLAFSSCADVATNVTAVLCKTPAGVIHRGETAEMVLQPGFSPKDLSWRLLDWRGNEVRRGVWPAEGPLRLEKLPVGAYTLIPTYPARGRAGNVCGAPSCCTGNVCGVPSRRTTEEDQQQLHDTIVTVVEPLERPLPRDSYFAIMTALSCCTIPDAAANRRFRGDYPWFGGDGTLLHAELLKTLGIPNVREILLWSREQTVSNAPAQIEKAREEPAWRYLAERGICVDFFNQSTPLWAVGTTKRALRHDGVLRDVTRNLTRDYKRLYDYYKWAAETFSGRAISFEHWNEPDICGDEPAWDYAASMKAAYLGVKAGNAKVPVLQGSFCRTPFTGYNRLVMANDVARYSDIFNYHTYADLRDIPSFMEGLRRNLAEAGVPNRAIWLTEMNTNQEGDADLPSVRAGNRAHSPDQQRLLVEYVAKGEILHLMEGVARTFYFILPGINEREGRKDWGLSRRDGCVKPAYAALANLIRRVGHARLVGEMGLGKGVRGFLFDQDDGTQTLVVWAQSELDTGGLVSRRPAAAGPVVSCSVGRASSPCAGVTVYDACGTPRTEKVENGVLHLTVDRYATYVTGLRGLKAARPARQAGAVGALPTPVTMDPTLVVRIDLDERDFALGGQKTIAEMNVPEGRATIVVWNLSDKSKNGSLSVEGAVATGLPASVTVPAWGKAEVPVRLLAESTTSPTAVWIRGTFGGKTISPLKMQVRNQAALEAGARVVTPDLSDLASWQKNDNAQTRSFVWDAQEKAFRFDAAWDADERNPWAFERLLIDPNRVKGLLAVEYEAKMVQDKIENDTKHSVFYVCNGPKFKPSSYRVEPPRDGWERRRVTILPEHAADVTGIQFGCCPRGRKLTFWVRNVRLLCAGEAADPAEVFRRPSASAKTGVWWHWMGTGVTREGIVRDLDWMQRMGVGLVQIFACADTCTPGPADLKGGPAPSLVGGTDDWWKLVRFATEEAVRHGIEVSAHNCPGYSHTGGTWTTPEHAMRDLVFEVEGEAPKPEAKRWVDKREIATVEAKGRRIRISHVAKPSFCSPTQRAATGYECDKMSPEAVNAHWDHVIGQVRRHLGPFVGKGFNALHMDSYEARKPSWTPKMREEFKTRRGYDPLPLLPVLGGFPVADEKTEKKFKADFDRTIADLYREVVFRLSAERCHAAGLQLTLEPYSGPFVPKEVAPYADLLMTEFWLPATPWRAYDIPPAGRRWADLRGLKSDTHLKGATAPIVAAEAFTCFPTDADWRETPAKIKRTADLRYVMGINRFILHSVVLQPWGDGIKPGMSFGCWGTHFGRNQTWAEDGKGMFDYFNRCQALLQWGERGTDADCILGEPFGEIVRKAGDVRVRFVVNAAETNAAFNVSGEWFDAVRGTIGAPPATLVPGESGFLVTGRAGAAVQSPVPPPVPCATVRGPWRISWKSAAPGADPAPVVTEDLFDWTTSTNERVRHFSGTATYRRTFDCAMPASVTALSVGLLRGNLAHVRLNGRDLGVVWCAPERVAVPKGVLKAKGNILEIDVTNVWANRLIGDEAYPPIADWKDATCIGYAIGQRPLAYPAFLQTGRLPSDTKRTSFSMWNYFTKESKLEPSGLIGPVELLTTADAAPPMLEPEVTVPNGGTLRFFPFGDFTRGNVPQYAKVFEESPYQTLSALRYDRPNWFELESAEGAYLFDMRIEPMLEACVKNRQRLFLGLACNAGSMSVTQLHEGRALAVPLSVFERCAAEGHPFRPCDQYGPAWVPDYDSPYLLERHRALLKAFPDTLLCLGGHEFNALPTRAAFDRNPTDAQRVRAMAHVGKILKFRNAVGPLGFFIDSWQSPSDLYDRDGTRVYTDAAGRAASLADTLFGEIYRKRYVTGEFGYLTWLSDPKLAPYEKLVEQVETRGVSGLSVHNFTVKDLASLKGVKRERGAHYLPGGLPIDRATYARGSRALGLIGYRFVLGDARVERKPEGVCASFALSNIGASRLFHGYNVLHLQARDAAGQLIEDRRLAFDLRQLEPGTERRFAETFPSQTAEVALVIPDETGIEWPLALSNRGRRADGSYVLNGAVR